MAEEPAEAEAAPAPAVPPAPTLAQDMMAQSAAFLNVLATLATTVASLEKEVRGQRSDLMHEVSDLRSSLENLAHNIQGVEEEEEEPPRSFAKDDDWGGSPAKPEPAPAAVAALDGEPEPEPEPEPAAGAQPEPEPEAQPDSPQPDSPQPEAEAKPEPEPLPNTSPRSGGSPSRPGSPAKRAAPSNGEYVMKSEVARKRWKWACQQLKLHRMAQRMSVMHGRVKSNMTLGSRMTRMERRFNDMMYTMDSLKEDDQHKSEELFNRVQVQLQGLQKELVKVHKNIETHDMLIRDLIDSRENLQSDMNLMNQQHEQTAAQVQRLSVVPDRTREKLTLRSALEEYLRAETEMMGRLHGHEHCGELLAVFENCQEKIASVEKVIDEGQPESEVIFFLEKLTKALAALQDDVRSKARICTNLDWSTQDGEPFEKKIDWILAQIAIYFASRADVGKMLVRTLTMEERETKFVKARAIETLYREVRQVKEVVGEVETLKNQLAEGPNTEAINAAFEERLTEAIGNAKNDVMRDLRFELDEALMSRRSTSTDPADDVDVAAELGDAAEKIEALRADLVGKVDSKDLDDAMTGIQTQLTRIALETARKEQLELLAREKVDKGELRKLAGALANMNPLEDDNVVAGKQKLTCLSCNRPLPNMGKNHANGPPTLRTKPTRVDRSPERAASPPAEKTKAIVNLTPNAHQYALDPEYTRDGAVVSRYPRIMPPKARVRTAAGGTANMRSTARDPRGYSPGGYAPSTR
eukprot:CAMPEP_0118851570 /NCGR_PEP_ID=MMETSP1163-20130328/942_1 /TAXON_ID=124430 /ORGANISM="Phaeomonas parva, Strain CCMP2877" /LENGTH=752 /DNA_ID=CAMNT_0006783935 /DNA_START=208 /DNA_END=2466 /DNA_ORIENTATION=-